MHEVFSERNTAEELELDVPLECRHIGLPHGSNASWQQAELSPSSQRLGALSSPPSKVHVHKRLQTGRAGRGTAIFQDGAAVSKPRCRTRGEPRARMVLQQSTAGHVQTLSSGLHGKTRAALPVGSPGSGSLYQQSYLPTHRMIQQQKYMRQHERGQAHRTVKEVNDKKHRLLDETQTKHLAGDHSMRPVFKLAAAGQRDCRPSGLLMLDSLSCAAAQAQYLLAARHSLRQMDSRAGDPGTVEPLTHPTNADQRSSYQLRGSTARRPGDFATLLDAKKGPSLTPGSTHRKAEALQSRNSASRTEEH